MVGEALLLDGLDDYLSLENTPSMDFMTGDFTLELWINFNFLEGTDQTLINKISDELGPFPNDRAYLLEFDPPQIGNNFISCLRFLVRDTFPNQNDLCVEAPLISGHWYHLAAVRAGNTSSLYLDGDLLGSQTQGENLNTGSGGMAAIGKLAVSPARYVSGLMDEIGIYARALQPSEIQAIYQAGTSGKCRPPEPPREPHFHRGDPNGDGGSNVADAVYLLIFLFVQGEAPACLNAADSNDDGEVDIADCLHLLYFLFLQGPPPPMPGPSPQSCGLDTTPPDDLGCSKYSGC
ncbi:MAG: hypothetical protein HY717_20700 [Planctomycetes bacterium]|nr:hypothetical protein [Planctomycetota bacterium]